MAKRVILQSDLSGVESDDVQTRYFQNPADFSYREIDLTEAEWSKFMETLKPFMEASRASNWKPTGLRTAGNNSNGDNSIVREWARKNGHEIGDRGRISEEIMNAYIKATHAAPATEDKPTDNKPAPSAATGARKATANK